MKKIIIIIICIFSIATITAVAVYTYLRLDEANRSVTLNVAVSPKSSSITINGIGYQNGDTYKIAPGEYQVEISREEFDNYTTTLVFEADSTHNLYVALKLAHGDVADWYAKHPGEDEYLAKIDAAGYDDYINLRIKKYPILTHFPVVSTYYTILVDVSDDGKTSITIRINMLEPDPDIESQARQAEIYKKQALDKIRELGFDPSKYKITYLWLEY